MNDLEKMILEAVSRQGLVIHHGEKNGCAIVQLRPIARHVMDTNGEMLLRECVIQTKAEQGIAIRYEDLSAAKLVHIATVEKHKELMAQKLPYDEADRDPAAIAARVKRDVAISQALQASFRAGRSYEALVRDYSLQDQPAS